MSNIQTMKGTDKYHTGRPQHADTLQVLPILPMSAYRLTFEAEDEVRLPEYTGSTWRGAFGHALKRTVCVTRVAKCRDCLLYSSCMYAYVFETPPPPDATKMRLYTAAPHPFVLVLSAHQSRTINPGNTLDLGLNLFGRANDYLPYFIHAFQATGQNGLGAIRGRLSLKHVEQSSPRPVPDWQSIYSPGRPLTTVRPESPSVPENPGRCVVAVHTPLRLKRGGKNVTPKDFKFADLFGNLLRRISMLTNFHTPSPLETGFAELIQESRDIEARSVELSWKDWTRYSSRQHTTLQMGGVLGSFELDLSDHQGIWPYLWLGQWTHAGKATSMGLGRYSVERAASLPERTPGSE